MDMCKDDNENAYKPINATIFFNFSQAFSKHALVFKFSVDITKKKQQKPWSQNKNNIKMIISF